ncbi:MAG: hypothetical protein H6R25_1808 [Proteobacteria bacterium]|nr:hypothetical protein [Pseudomonadota bacterium]
MMSIAPRTPAPAQRPPHETSPCAGPAHKAARAVRDGCLMPGKQWRPPQPRTRWPVKAAAYPAGLRFVRMTLKTARIKMLLKHIVNIARTIKGCSLVTTELAAFAKGEAPMSPHILPVKTLYLSIASVFPPFAFLLVSKHSINDG